MTSTSKKRQTKRGPGSAARAKTRNADIPGIEYVDSDGGIEEFRLTSNNLQILYMRQGIVPVATMMVTYRVGSRNEPTGLTGATHFLEHLMFKGTQRFNKDSGNSIFETLQSVGAQVNATTWFDRTNYYEMLESEQLGLAMDIESDRMRGAMLREQDVASERTVILNEFDRGQNEPQRKLFHEIWSTAFQVHPYRHPTIGWRSDIENVSAADLKSFYDTFYWPNNATVSVIGDVDRKSVLTMIADRFGEIPPSPHPIPDITAREPDQSGERRFKLEMAGEVGSVILAYRIPDARHEDSDALAVLGEVMAGGKTSRLYRALTDRGLAAYAHASALGLRDVGLFYVMASGTPTISNEQIESEIDKVIAEMLKDGITEAELELAKQQTRKQTLFGRDSSFSIASHLNEAIAAGDWKLYSGYLDRVEATTLEDINRVARLYLRDSQKTVGFLVPTNE